MSNIVSLRAAREARGLEQPKTTESLKGLKGVWAGDAQESFDVWADNTQEAIDVWAGNVQESVDMWTGDTKITNEFHKMSDEERLGIGNNGGPDYDEWIQDENDPVLRRLELAMERVRAYDL